MHRRTAALTLRIFVSVTAMRNVSPAWIVFSPSPQLVPLIPFARLTLACYLPSFTAMGADKKVRQIAFRIEQALYSRFAAVAKRDKITIANLTARMAEWALAHCEEFG